MRPPRRPMVRPRVRLAAASALFLTLPAAACGGDCNDIGCSNYITYEVSGLPYPRTDTPVDVTACFADSCKTLMAMQRKRVFFGDSGSGDGLIYLTRNSASEPLRVDFDLDHQGEIDAGAEHDVSLRLQVGDSTPVTFDDRITLEDTTPENACGDFTCWGAGIEVPN